MPTPSDAPGSAFPNDPTAPGEVSGGADAAEKTSAVLGRGTEPEARREPGEAAPVLGGARSSLRSLAAAAILLLLGGLVYFLAR